jgi:hypothetical protein
VYTCGLAAWGGHLEVLQWLREGVCPWDTDTCLYTAANGHVEVLQWAREHGCPWEKHRCAVVSHGDPKTLAWVQAQPE